MENRLNEEGFIMQYLISGLREEPFIGHTADEISIFVKNTFDRFLPDLRQRSRRITGLN